jgi:hypothetical protein
MTVWTGKNRSLPAVAAATAAVAAEAAPLGAAREGVPGTGSGAAREGVPGTGSGTARAASRKAAEVGLAEGSAEAGESRNRLTGLRSGLVGR